MFVSSDLAENENMFPWNVSDHLPECTMS